MSKITSKKIKMISLIEQIEKKEIGIPKFQRGAIWNNYQKKRLLDSIKRNFPIGMILLFKQETRDSDGNITNISLIIDGLQRCKVIYDFYQKPTLLYSESDIYQEIPDQIYLLLNENGNENDIKREIRKLFSLWLKSHISRDDLIRIQYDSFYIKLREKYHNLEDSIVVAKTIASIIKPFIDEVIDIIKEIEKKEISYDEYEGSVSTLSEVYERINSSGSYLTKYQIYSATMLDEYYITNNILRKLVELNHSRYLYIVKYGFPIDGFKQDEFLNEGKLNVFELLYGFGKHLMLKYPHLFGVSKDPNIIPSIGFTLVNACLCSENKNAGAISLRIKTILKNSDIINKFLIDIIKCIESVDKKFRPITLFKSNKRKENSSTFHSEFQICSIIGNLFVSKRINILDFNKNGAPHVAYLGDENKVGWGKVEESFFKNVLKIYILDILANKWKSAGDSKLDEIVLNSSYYTREIEWPEFEKSLNNWFTNLNSDRQELTKVSSVKNPERLILNLVYLDIFTAKDQLDESEFDIEHLATKSIMLKILSKYKGEIRLPVSSIANLAFLLQYTNRSKKGQTIYSDGYYWDNLKNMSRKEVEMKLTFTSESDLAFLDKDLLAEEFKFQYYLYIEKRFKIMVEKVKSNFLKI